MAVTDTGAEHSLSFRVMGCDALVVVHTGPPISANWFGKVTAGGTSAEPVAKMGDHGPADLLGRAEARLRELAARWTRFDESSELNALNAGAGRPVAVSAETFAVVELALDAWRLTEGWFDPTVLPMLAAAGYDRSFERLAGRPLWYDRPAHPAPGCGEIELDPEGLTVTLPRGVAIDLGGIGKGRAADLVAADLVAGGAVGACVDLGGDVAVAGEAGDGEPWVIGIADPFENGRDGCRVVLRSGAVATSSRLRRQWRTANGPAHHLIDPTTGRPAGGRLATVSVLASTAAWAEVLSKATLVSGDETIPERFGCTGLVVELSGAVRHLPGLEDWLL